MTDPMRASGVGLALGPKLPAMLEAAGADVVTIHSSPSPGHGNGLAARIVGPGEEVSMSNGIARADVAAFMLAEVASPAHPRGKVVITAT